MGEMLTTESSSCYKAETIKNCRNFEETIITQTPSTASGSSDNLINTANHSKAIYKAETFDVTKLNVNIVW